MRDLGVMEVDVPREGVKSVQIRLLGRFGIVVAGSEVRLETKKAESLFAFLALQQNRALSREKVLAAIWPDWEEGRARGNLNTALWRIRKSIGKIPGITLVGSRDTLCLRLDEAV